MTERLFEQNSYLTDTDARVVDCRQVENGYAILLDRTVFFPEGGGQPRDMGTIDGLPVTDLFEEGEEILHLCPAPLPVGKTVSLSVDFERRMDLMQQHTGEHILSYSYWKLFGAVNVGFHLNETFGTIDLDQTLTPEQIAGGVALANRIVRENRPITAYLAAAKSLDKKRVRKISAKGGDTPRVVEIEDGDICTCCGTHLSTTAQVQVITVIKAEKNRGGSRLTFLCGGRALADYEQKTRILHALTTGLSTDGEQVPLRVEEMKKELQEARVSIKEKNRLLMELQAKELLQSRGDGPYVLACLKEASPAEAKTLLNLLTKEPVIAIVVFTAGDALTFFCGAHPQAKGQSCRTVCDLLCGIFNGKGGGKENFAQGGGKASGDFADRAAQVVEMLRKMDQ